MSRTPLTTASVIETAAALADKAGFDAVSLSAVARTLGVQAPSLYSHVRNLEALRDGISELAMHDLGARISVAIAGLSGRAALHGFADAHRDFARSSPGGWQALQRRMGESVARSNAARTVVDLNLAVLRGYDLPGGEQVHAIRLVGSTINGFITLESLGSFAHSEPHSDVSWDRALDALDTVLRTWPVTAGDRP